MTGLPSVPAGAASVAAVRAKSYQICRRAGPRGWAGRSTSPRMTAEEKARRKNPTDQWCGQFRGGKEEISGTVRLKRLHAQ
ncbi:hypothetical protein, partial [Deinococcus wulumuqiensis]